MKNKITESAGVSFEVREWANIIYHLLDGLDNSEPRLLVDGQEWPEQFEKFSVDWFVIDFNDWTNGYLDGTSGYDADGNYVVHIMVLNQFRHHPYMKTILNHEIKHAYQDWQRRRKGYEGIFAAKEVKDVYTEDFIKVVKDRIKVGNFFKDILKKYYLLTDLELNAFMENVYDNDYINNYKRLVKDVTQFDAYRATYYESPEDLEKDWQTLLSVNIPFLKKYKTYTDFLSASTDYFKKRGEEILKKINKLEYVHKDRNLGEGLIKEQQVTCQMISPKPKGGGNYMSNQEALELMNTIQVQGRKEIHDPKILAQFVKTLSDFRQNIKDVDTNNDTLNTYLHKLRTLLNCYGMETKDNSPEDFVF
jgi:hypothetical protein